ncbi:MAG: DUF883 family protein [Sideroxydans sp.]|nr:DUF883 family protein [Sideroxydans sp.]
MTTKPTHQQHADPKDKLMEDLHLVMADAEALLRATVHQAGAEAANARERIQARLETVKARLGDAESAVSERAQQAAQDTDQYVHDHPWKAIGISACVGAIVGLLIARR